MFNLLEECTAVSLSADVGTDASDLSAYVLNPFKPEVREAYQHLSADTKICLLKSLAIDNYLY